MCSVCRLGSHLAVLCYEAMHYTVQRSMCVCVCQQFPASSSSRYLASAGLSFSSMHVLGFWPAPLA
jgi:hypothetical protein